MRPICHGPGVQVVAFGARGRACAAAHHRGEPAIQRGVDLLRADEVNVHLQPAGGYDLALGGDCLRPRPDHDIDPG